MTDAYRQFLEAKVLVGDCLDVMRTLEAESVGAIVTDPPYGLGFMGKAWDDPRRMGDIAMRRNSAMDAVNTGAAKQGGRQRAGLDYQKRQARDARAFAEWCEQWAAEALRVAKPGAYLAAFGGTRMFHRLACGIEDAGWELRDSILRAHMPQPEDCPWLLGWMYGSGFPKSHNGEWGGTALKPAWEPIVLARKPLEGTVEANWRKYGTGALNIDGCRVPTAGDDDGRWGNGTRPSGFGNVGADKGGSEPCGRKHDAGRWPANVIHDGSEEVLAAFPDAPGQQGDLTGNEPSAPFKNAYGEMARTSTARARGDSGSAARFFYCAKASRTDRDDGCEGIEPAMVHGPSGDGRCWDIPGSKSQPKSNNHPTVKPTDLMRWLCRLVTPPGGLVLDPFAGSGSTGRGAVLEGLRFVGIELSEDYAAIARARIAAAVRQRAEEVEEQRIATMQGDIFGEAA